MSAPLPHATLKAKQRELRQGSKGRRRRARYWSIRYFGLCQAELQSGKGRSRQLAHVRCELLPGHVHDGCDRSPDPFGGSLDFPVAEMGVTQCHADVGVTEHP